MDKKEILKSFQIMPGVGNSIAEDLWNIGFRSLDEIKTQDPYEMYEKCCEYQGIRVDRCVLYVMKCIQYYLNTENQDPELLKWWNWSDDNLKKNYRNK